METEKSIYENNNKDVSKIPAKRGRPKRALESAEDISSALKSPKNISNTLPKNVDDVSSKNITPNTLKKFNPDMLKFAIENVAKQTQNRKSDESLEFVFDPVLIGEVSVEQPLRTKSTEMTKPENMIPISQLVNTSITNNIPSSISSSISSFISSSVRITSMSSMTSTSMSSKTLSTSSDPEIKKQNLNLSQIGASMRKLTTETCYMKKLEILDSLLPKAKNIPHEETRRIQIIGILEMILKYIQYIHGRDITKTMNELKQKIDKLKTKQAEVEKERERIYQMRAEEILTNLTKNIGDI